MSFRRIVWQVSSEGKVLLIRKDVKSILSGFFLLDSVKLLMAYLNSQIKTDCLS